MLVIIFAAFAIIVFILAARRASHRVEPGEAEQVLAQCLGDDWSEQDQDDYIEYFAEFGEF